MNRSVRNVLLVGLVFSALVMAMAPARTAGARSPGSDGPGDLPQASITGDLSSTVPISDQLYGVFYEDINHAADGGLYAELVQNRSFEFAPADDASYDGLTAWERFDEGAASGEVAVVDNDPLNGNNPHYLRVDVTEPGAGRVAVRNTGFNVGMRLAAGKAYDFSMWARHDGTVDVPMEVRLTDGSGDTVLDRVGRTVSSPGWTKYEATLRPDQTTTNGRLVLAFDGEREARVDVDMVSLFPRDTFEGRDNGMRPDLAQWIADLKPSFFRFPGGCVVNTGSFEPFPARERAYDWKDTVGPVEERPTNHNFWGYNQSYGIGYYEYFQFAEDVGAEPLPVVPVGVNGCGDTHRITDPEELRTWVRDTLDLIEFANGDTDTEWGKVRAEMGHPEPFGLEYIALGNEESDPQFYENYPYFHEAIRAEYPNIDIVSNSGPSSSGEVFDRSWEFARQQGADLVDEHYYNSPEWLLSNSDRYDSYDRAGPHVFLGEYASRGNTFYNALSEAAYLTGVERNGDVVDLASYAPLLANTDYVDWSPDLIWFDNHRSFGSANYYVQRMFSANRGDQLVPTKLDADPVPVPDISGGVGLATWNTRAAYDNVKVTADDGSVLFSDDFTGGAGAWTPNANGSWSVLDGEYRQTELAEDARSVAGDPDWSSYTLDVDARKLSGSEGFLVMFGVADSGNYYWWNLGGWNNTMSGIEVAHNGSKSTIADHDTTVETGKTYHIRIRVDGRQITAWLDGEKLLDFTDDLGTVEPLYHVLTRDTDTGEVVLKVVNARDTAVRTDVDLAGYPLQRRGRVTTLTAKSLTATNTFDNPTAVTPRTRREGRLGNHFGYTFAPNSVTFIRLPPAP